MTTLLQDYEAAIRRAENHLVRLNAIEERWGWQMSQRECDERAYWRAELAALRTRHDNLLYAAAAGGSR